jgi:hypothetical protein
LFENEILSVSATKSLIFEEILLYHFPAKLTQYEGNKAVFDARPAPPVPRQESDSEEEELA